MGLTEIFQSSSKHNKENISKFRVKPSWGSDANIKQDLTEFSPSSIFTSGYRGKIFLSLPLKLFISSRVLLLTHPKMLFTHPYPTFHYKLPKLPLLNFFSFFFIFFVWQVMFDLSWTLIFLSRTLLNLQPLCASASPNFKKKIIDGILRNKRPSFEENFTFDLQWRHGRTEGIYDDSNPI